MKAQTISSPRSGFSLVELLVVIAILVLLAAVSLPAFNSVTRGSNLQRAGQMIGDQFALARQEAVARNRDVMVQFYETTDVINPGWRQVQILRVEQSATGEVHDVQVSRKLTLPDGIVIATNHSLSPLLGSSGAVRFRASGSVAGSLSPTNNYLTLISAGDDDNPPKNFLTLQLNPLTGKAAHYQP
jgi:uncharacterized protein (TIGR02596 family)